MKGKTNRPQGSTWGLLILLALAIPACSAAPQASPSPTPQPPALEVTQAFAPTATNPATATTVLDTLTPTAALLDTITPQPTQVAVVKVNSQVQRLVSSVFAGQTQPLAEVLTNDLVDLQADSQVTTDKNGQAEIQIQGCLKLFLFQSAGLTRQTCRKEDSASGLGVCATAGLTGVLNDCLSSVDIQTPGSTVQTNGTWFTVLYLPDEKLSMVQVYEGAVSLHGVVDPQTGSLTGNSRLPAGELWFSVPGQETPVLGGIEGRSPVQLEVWQAMRPELIAKHPEIDKWYESAQARAQAENLPFPSFLAPPTGKVTVHVAGSAWKDTNLQKAFLATFPWTTMVQDLWLDSDVTAEVDFPQAVQADARGYAYDPNQASATYQSGDFYNAFGTITIGVSPDDYNGESFGGELQQYLGDVNIASQVTPMSQADIQAAVKQADAQPYGAFIWLEFSGDAFQ